MNGQGQSTQWTTAYRGNKLDILGAHWVGIQKRDILGNLLIPWIGQMHQEFSAEQIPFQMLSPHAALNGTTLWLQWLLFHFWPLRLLFASSVFFFVLDQFSATILWPRSWRCCFPRKSAIPNHRILSRKNSSWVSAVLIVIKMLNLHLCERAFRGYSAVRSNFHQNFFKATLITMVICVLTRINHKLFYSRHHPQGTFCSWELVI